jgi:hypothetical protein
MISPKCNGGTITSSSPGRCKNRTGGSDPAGPVIPISFSWILIPCCLATNRNSDHEGSLSGSIGIA